MKVREMIRLLEDNGWRLDRIRGDHRIFKKVGARNIVVPGNLGDEMAKGTQNSCLKTAGLKSDK